MADKKYLSKINKDGNTLYIKDDEARQAIPTKVSELTNDSGYGTGTITGVSVNGTSVSTSGVANITSVPASILTGAIPSAVTATTQSQGDGSTKVATTSYVDTAIASLPTPMVFKGSLGTGGTITELPTASSANTGYTYKVITAGTYASQSADVGDTFVSDGTAWVLIPSGDEPDGTVTSVTINATSPISIDSNSAITTSGTRTISHATSGATAGSYGDSSAQTPAYGGTFKVPYLTVNETGHVTGISEHNVTIPASDNTDTSVTSVDNHYIPTGSTGNTIYYSDPTSGKIRSVYGFGYTTDAAKHFCGCNLITKDYTFTQSGGNLLLENNIIFRTSPLNPVDIDDLTPSSTFSKGDIIGLNGTFYHATSDTSNFPITLTVQDGEFVVNTINGKKVFVVADNTLQSGWEQWSDAQVEYWIDQIETQLDGKQATISDLSTIRSGAAAGATALQSHQSVTNSNPTLSWGSTSTVGNVGGTSLQVTMPSNPLNGEFTYNGTTYQISDLLAAVARLMESTVVTQ